MSKNSLFSEGQGNSPQDLPQVLFPQIDILNIEDTTAAFALRGCLEAWDLQVRLTQIPTAQRLIDILSVPSSLAPTLLLMCHGNKNGLLLPILAPEIAATMPYEGTINASQFHSFLKLEDQVIINTGCTLGNQEFANAFLEGGCSSYIGADGYPEGDSALFYVLHLLFELYCQRTDISTAHEKARAHNEETAYFKLYTC